MVCPKLDLTSCFRHHFLSVDKYAFGFKWEHLRRDWPICIVYHNPLLSSMVAYAVQLRLPAELGESCGVILVHPDVRVVRGEGEVSAVDEDSLEDAAMAAPRRDTIGGKVRYPF
jgi:hypothetical protein